MKLSPVKTIGLVLLAIIVLIGGLVILVYKSIVQTIEVEPNPDGSHYGKLFRHNGIDINFRVQVDGNDVYYSPDFAPVEHDFREQISWDKSGHNLILEVAGKRLFGYNAAEKRPLTDDELRTAEYVPFSEYRYEGKLPN